MHKPVGVAVIGDVLDINTWSNTPYYFYTTGNRVGLFQEPWQLNLHQFNLSRKIWNACRLLTGKGVGGYQYSAAFLNKAEASIPVPYFSSTVISFNQVFPRATTIIQNGGEIYYYIDSTLTDLFKEEAYAKQVPHSLQKMAIAQEKENYQLATKVVSMGSWSGTSLINDYQLPAEKITHILPGANMQFSNHSLISNLSGKPGIDRPLVLGFIGKDWQRKGLPLLLDVRDLLHEKGFKVLVKAIGECPQELQNREGLSFTGFLNKQTDLNRFVEIVQSCDIGCLFSTFEALGISVLEFLRLGIPVTGFYHQGLQDTLFEDASIRFAPHETAEAVANKLQQFIEDDAYRLRLQEGAANRANYVTWERSIEEWELIIRN